MNNNYNTTDVSNDFVLKDVQVLLITTDEYAHLAVQSYLHPFSGNNIGKYVQCEADEWAFYIIGKYGECTSAIRNVNPETSAINNVSSMASQCFPKLSAIFIVGTITGVSSKSCTFDVLVSTNVCTYKVANDTQISKTAIINTSSLFCELFSQPPKWPKVGNRLVDRLKIDKPHLHQGTILCGPDVNEHIKLMALSPRAIGIDNDSAKLFTGSSIMNNKIVIVKCVSDTHNTQPTAALLAADCLEHYLMDPQLPQFLTACKGTCV